MAESDPSTNCLATPSNRFLATNCRFKLNSLNGLTAFQNRHMKTYEKALWRKVAVYVCDAVKWFLQPCTPVTGWIGFALNFCSTLCKVQFQGYPSKMFCNKLHVAALPYHQNRMDWFPMVWCTISAAPYCKMSAR